MTVYTDTFEFGSLFSRQHHDVVSAFASVDSDGGERGRVTATRIALAGPFALAAKKGRRKAAVYVTVAGDGWSVAREFETSDALKARSFAAAVNSAARAARP